MWSAVTFKAGINQLNSKTSIDTAVFNVRAQPYGARRHFDLSLRLRWIGTFGCMQRILESLSRSYITPIHRDRFNTA